jgi:FixJ family two-component response regulator
MPVLNGQTPPSTRSADIRDSAAVTAPARLSLVVVDDDPEVRKALLRLLVSLGHDVRLFGSAEELEAGSVAADCLILDVRLPGLNGPELRERLRRRGSSTPIVFITGDGGPSARDLHVPGTPFVTKPFDESELVAAIDRAVAAGASRSDD